MKDEDDDEHQRCRSHLDEVGEILSRIVFVHVS